MNIYIYIYVCVCVCMCVYGVDWVGFNGISTIVGYLMPNPLYTYILNIYDFA